jgi:hypothetical protein
MPNAAMNHAVVTREKWLEARRKLCGLRLRGINDEAAR